MWRKRGYYFSALCTDEARLYRNCLPDCFVCFAPPCVEPKVAVKLSAFTCRALAPLFLGETCSFVLYEGFSPDPRPIHRPQHAVNASEQRQIEGAACRGSEEGALRSRPATRSRRMSRREPAGACKVATLCCVFLEARVVLWGWRQW